MSASVVATLRAAGCVFAEEEATLLIEAAHSPAELDRLVALRVAGQPLEHLLGWVLFYGTRIGVAPGVFVPRRRTELLARLASSLCREGSVVVDMCCGSGAVGAVLAGVEAHAVDVDPAAVECARSNLPDGSVYLGDLYDALPSPLRGRIDVLVANAPYVPTASIALMPPEARVYEPAIALDGGEDGLDVQRRILARAPNWLAPGGHVLIETSREQARVLAECFEAAHLSADIVEDDDLAATVVVGTTRAPSSD